MHQALYRKWRPQVFDDVCGQEHITSILRYEAEHGAFSHAYLFCGSRGTGKTTCAKILAKVLNCESPIGGSPCGRCAACQAIEMGSTTDVLEMDAASNNGVDNIRDIRDEVVYSPSTLRYRVYIIDEVHMLSTSAFNALLKTLEEPPQHVVFILATTELQKLPATIISRCQRFDFRRITTEVLMERLQYIAKQEDISLTEEAARMLAKLAQGGMRDAISLLELCAGGRRVIDARVVEESVGLTGRDAMLRVLQAVADKDLDMIFAQIDEVVRSSKDLSVFWQDLIALYRDILVVKTTKDAKAYLDLTEAELQQISAIASRFGKEQLLLHCRLLEDALYAMQRANSIKRIVAEMALLRMCDDALSTTPESLLSRIARLEEQMLTGQPIVKRSPETEHTKQAPTIPTASPSQEEQVLPKRTAAKKEPSAPLQKSEDKPVLRPIRNWLEVVERIGRSEKMVASFVRTARGYTTEDGGVLVRFDNAFGKNMMEQSAAKEHLRAALCAALRQDIPNDRLQFELMEQGTQSTEIDEILDASDEA